MKDLERLNNETSRKINGEASLDQLAERVRAAHRIAQAAWSNALDHIFIAGDALIEIQVRGVGMPWKKWLRDNCFLGGSTAALYMQIARHRAEIDAALEKNANLSLRAARRLIAKPKSLPESSTKTSSRQQQEELEARNSEIADLKTVVANPQPVDLTELAATLPRITLTQCLKIMPPNWLPQLEARVSEHLPAPALLDLLERRLERDDIDASALLQKIRKLIDRPKIINLKAMPAAAA